MADLQHVALLERSTKVWNHWRAENPHIVPNLSSARFRKAQLIGANLSFSDIRGASFENADMQHSDLRECRTGITNKWKTLFYIQQLLLACFTGKIIFFVCLNLSLLFFIATPFIAIIALSASIFIFVTFFFNQRRFKKIIKILEGYFRTLKRVFHVFISICGIPTALGGRLFSVPGAMGIWIVNLISAVEDNFSGFYLFMLIEPLTGIAVILLGLLSGYSGYEYLKIGTSNSITEKTAALLFGWKGSIFKNTNLSDANLTQTNLDFCDFRGSALDRVNFYGCNLSYLIKTDSEHSLLRSEQINKLITQKSTPIAKLCL
ncbi:MAG: pentapeptide repeat-containing protein [Leptolyngbyaceae cyanobacterium]